MKKRIVLTWFMLFCLTGCGAPTMVPTPLSPTVTPIPPTATLIPTLMATPTATAVQPLSGSGGGVIAFTVLSGNDWNIHLMNADGSGQRRLATGSQHGYEPSWSPNGTKIVFQYRGLFILNIPTGEIARLSLTQEGDNLKNRYFVKPSWSPNGEWIAFLNEDGFLGDIYLVRPDGTDLTRLTNSNDISRDGNLVWSPDGRQIAFSAERDGRIEIYILNIENVLQGGDRQRQVTDTPKATRNLVTSWLPDGSKIAFSSTRDGNTEIYLMDVDGNGLIRLTNNPASDAEPAWSPDGKMIVFSSNRNGNEDIYVLDIEEAIQGTGDDNARQITDSPNTDAGPVWRPAP